MSALKKVTVEDRGGIRCGWQGTKLEHLHKVEGEIILEDIVTGEALVAIEDHQLVIAVQGRAGDDWKWWMGVCGSISHPDRTSISHIGSHF